MYPLKPETKRYIHCWLSQSVLSWVNQISSLHLTQWAEKHTKSNKTIYKMRSTKKTYLDQDFIIWASVPVEVFRHQCLWSQNRLIAFDLKGLWGWVLPGWKEISTHITLRGNMFALQMGNRATVSTMAREVIDNLVWTKQCLHPRQPSS